MIWLACLLASAGCRLSTTPGGDRDAVIDPGPVDGGGDAESGSDAGQDAGEDAGEDGGDVCERERAREAAFVAAHRSCAVHSDCVSVGDCGNADFIAVSARSQAEAQALVDARTCRVQDGPTYHAICRDGACELAYARVWCGDPGSTSCPDGQAWYNAGCGSTTQFSGCFTACRPGDASACSPGYTCQEVDVDPCGVDSPLGEPCDICGAPAHLCKPDPACQVSAQVTLDGRDIATLPSDGAAILAIQLFNRTEAPLTFSFDLPCHGPDVSGLAGYDLWNACEQGPCSEDIVRHTVTLAAHESKTLAETLLGSVATPCNSQPPQPGKYRLGFQLTNVRGAQVCAAPAAQLNVVEGTTHW